MVEGESVWIPLRRPGGLPSLAERQNGLQLVEQGGDDQRIESVMTHVRLLLSGRLMLS
jgi:hypothetical protein